MTRQALAALFVVFATVAGAKHAHAGSAHANVVVEAKVMTACSTTVSADAHGGTTDVVVHCVGQAPRHNAVTIGASAGTVPGSTARVSSSATAKGASVISIDY